MTPFDIQPRPSCRLKFPVKLSVVIATFNRGDVLLRTLESLAAQRVPFALFEIIVVNNNSTDNTAAVGERFATEHPELNFRMLFEPIQGLSPARNRGINDAKGAYIVVIDDDELVNPDFIKIYYEFFIQHPQVAACGGRIVPRYEFPVPCWLSSYAERPIAGRLDLGNKMRSFPANKYPGGGNMAVRRSALDRYGMFDPALGRTGTSPMGGEEKDLFQRLRQGGEQIWYLPDAVIYHLIPERKLSVDYFSRLTRMTGVSERVRTLSKSRILYTKRLLSEGVKWGGTVVLFLGYTLRGEPLKGIFLFRMRWNTTLGLLGFKVD